MNKLILFAAILLTACSAMLSVTVEDYGCLSTGEETHKYILMNKSGASVQLCDYGARFVSINVPDRTG